MAAVAVTVSMTMTMTMGNIRADVGTAAASTGTLGQQQDHKHHHNDDENDIERRHSSRPFRLAQLFRSVAILARGGSDNDIEERKKLIGSALARWSTVVPDRTATLMNLSQ